MSKKLWGGRFDGETDGAVERFTCSVDFDSRLYRQDIAGSIAHARMLGEQGIIGREEAGLLVAGLLAVREEIDSGEFVWRVEDEDVHMNIERRLTEKIGPVGGKLHTARSRNDQVATDLRLYCMEAAEDLATRAQECCRAILDQAERNVEVIAPGYTHMQRAQPIVMAHHLLAWFEMILRDRDRFVAAGRAASASPLGAAALAGSSFPIDRRRPAAALGFARVIPNSIDAVADRDFAVELTFACALCAAHLSRIAEETVLWATAEFRFIQLPDALSTGSSIMPQKKNPDIAELIRGKSGRVYGDLLALLTMLKGLPLAYNRDMQEDKRPLFDAIDEVGASLSMTALLAEGLRFQRERLEAATREGFLNATDLADRLAARGVPFRQAHEIAGRAVAYCLERSLALDDLKADDLAAIDARLDERIVAEFSPRACVEARRSEGGTAPERVRQALIEARERLQARA